MAENSGFTFEALRQRSLDDVDRMYGLGMLSRDFVLRYIDEWNATPGRFSVAALTDSRIRLKLKADG